MSLRYQSSCRVLQSCTRPHKEHQEGLPDLQQEGLPRYASTS